MTLSVGPEFDIILPDEPTGAPPAGMEVVPYAAVEELLWGTLAKDPAFSAAFALIGSAPAASKLSFLAPPPPLPIEAVRECLEVEPFFAQKAAQLGVELKTVKLVPDTVRAKVWKVLLGVYKALAQRYGAPLILPPTAATDAAGVLARDFWSGDVTHANADYGRLYVQTILSHLLDART
jgi:hypothetical protein